MPINVRYADIHGMGFGTCFGSCDPPRRSNGQPGKSYNREDEGHAHLWTTTIVRSLVPVGTTRFARNGVAVNGFPSKISAVEVL